MTLLINKISTLRKMNSLDSALNICNSILIKTPHDLIVMYHKLRILQMLERYNESLEICDEILSLYPNNGDVLYDKASNLALLDKTERCLEALSLSTQISKKFKIKARNDKRFQTLQKKSAFRKLIK